MRLYLLRHAKSSWAQPQLPDQERPLSSRGKRAARAMAAFVRATGIRMDCVLTSPARRAQDTARIVLEGVGPGPEVVSALYLASAGEILRLIRRLDENVRHVAVVGHNPGFHDFAYRLCGHGGSEALGQLAAKFPTGALAEIDIDGSGWNGVAFGAGRLLRFVRPKDLPRAEELGL